MMSLPKKRLYLDVCTLCRPFDNQQGFAFVRAEHLMPLTPDDAPQTLDELMIS